MTALGSPDRFAGTLALPVAITALLAALALAPGCVIVANDSDLGGDCINPFDDSCFNCMGGCGGSEDGDATAPPAGEGEGEDPPPAPDADGDGLSDSDEAALGTDPSAADTDGDGQCDKAELDCGSSPLDPFFRCTA
jgi:hypothetical protein